jgi:hypothetical protein
VIFVEDEFAKIWMEAILRQSPKPIIEHFQVHAMSGDGAAVSMNKYHNANPAIKFPSVCVIDGDSRQADSEEDKVYRLPGGNPEAFVFDKCLELWSQIGGKLSVALLQKFEDSDKVLGVCRDVRRTNLDAHLLFSQVGERLGLVPERTVSSAFTTIWAQSNSDEVNKLLSDVMKGAQIASN